MPLECGIACVSLVNVSYLGCEIILSELTETGTTDIINARDYLEIKISFKIWWTRRFSVRVKYIHPRGSNAGIFSSEH